MISVSFKDFSAMAKKGNLVPVYAVIPADMDTPVSAFLKIKTGKYDFLLESMEGGEKWGRYSILGTSPQKIIRTRDKTIEVEEEKKKKTFVVQGSPLSFLKETLSAYKPVAHPDLPRFAGGAIGYVAYDMARHFEKLPATAKNDLGIPESVFFITDTIAIFDNLKQVIILVNHAYLENGTSLKKAYAGAVKKIEALAKRLAKPAPALKKAKKTKTTLKPNRSEKEFCALVEKAKEYIKAGDIFQVQVSTRFEGKTTIDPFTLYRALRRINPSPYLYFFSDTSLSLVGASPELMVRLEDGKMDLRPIAGTRRRGRTEEDDIRMEKELRADPKERAEHVMLVDLGRNDLGVVAKTGTVHVSELEVVERYSHVMHLVSHVSAQVKPGCDAFDVLKATFPAGTLTGAPKIRSMEIIEELEGIRRGVYGGCVGYIGFNGNMDMAITIRTALFTKGKIYVQAAGGVVYDSIPEREYLECRNKARALMTAVESVS
ncbi:anthranilate synthase component I [bacterium]|nr:anthranilate synthase component I [bacterium]